MAKQSTQHYRGAGRPTQEQSLRRQQELLEKALDMFLKKGYTQTTLDDIASAMRMTKRTIYSAYGGKEALFRSAVARAIEKNRTPLAEMRNLESGSLESTLKKVAELRLGKLLSPDGVRLQRIVNVESYRFPELVQMVYRDSTGPTIEFLTELLSRYAANGEIEIDHPEACAGIFLNMAVGTPARASLAGMLPPASMSQQQHIDYCVHLFLHGVVKR